MYNGLKSIGMINMDDALSVIIRVERKNDKSEKLMEQTLVVSRVRGGWKFVNHINFNKGFLANDDVSKKYINQQLDDIIFLANNQEIESLQIEVIDIETNKFQIKLI